MKSTHLSCFQHRHPAASALPLVLLCLSIYAATANPISGDLTVNGSKVSIVKGSYQFEIRNVDGRVDFWQNDPEDWVWSHGTTTKDVMALDLFNGLSLYDFGESTDPSIVLNPGNPATTPDPIPASILIGGSQVLTVANSPSLIATNFVARSSSNLGSQQSFLMEGDFGVSGDIPTSGVGTRMMWYPEKAAFRAGTVSSAADYYWDYSYTGEHSVAMGLDVLAQGAGSAAFGYENYAIGDYYFTAGIVSTASGYASTAIGHGAYAEGNSAVALGESTAVGDASFSAGQGWAALDGSVAFSNAYSSGINAFAAGWSYTEGFNSFAFGSGSTMGDYSGAIGHQSQVSSFASFAVGKLNEDRHDSSNWQQAATAWQGDDQHSVFEVGIGQYYYNRANALTVLQDGSVEIGKDSTDGSIPLHVKADGSVVLAKPQGDISMGDYQ